MVPSLNNSAASWLEVGGQKMSDYLRALKALDWLNRNTDYRVNNASGDYPKNFAMACGGIFGVSSFSTQKSLSISLGDDLIALAEREGWKGE